MILRARGASTGSRSPRLLVSAGTMKTPTIKRARKAPAAAARPAWTPELVRELLRRLRKAHPDAKCSLDYRSPLELLVATILSAQCTDERVNMVTPALFARYRTARDFAEAKTPELEKAIQSTGFFRSKAKSIQTASRDIVEQHHGEVPKTLEQLTALHGVGRKTANVVLGNAYGVPGITVDTHVGRVSRRLGLTRESDPEKVERDLMEKIPRKQWTTFSHQPIHHGRRICIARKPHCSSCPLLGLCPRIGVTISD